METLIDSLTRAARWVAGNSLEASLLMVAFLLLFLALGRQLAPTLRVALWTVVGVRLLLPFAPPSQLSVHNLYPAANSPASEAATVATGESATLVTAAVSFSESETKVPAAPKASRFQPSWKNTAAIVWAGVALGLLAAALVRQRKVHRRIVRLPLVSSEALRKLYHECARQSGVIRRLRLVAAPAGSGVAVFGFLRESHLIVPADLEDRYSETEIRGILLHELAHVRRGDLLINWIVLAVQCLHWFNPLVWFAGRRFLADREVLCDRAALRGLSPVQRRDYGKALIKALQLGRAPQVCPALVPFVSRKSELEHRLTMIAKPHSRSLFLQFAAGAFAIAIALTTFTSARADGEREGGREGARDGETENAERSREGARDGDRPREGARDGDRPREGARDGDRPREGARDGDRPREGSRDGTREGARDGEAATTSAADHEVKVYRDGVTIGDRKYSTMAEFRNALRGQSGSSALVTADSNTPFQTVNAVIDTLKASGIRDVKLASQSGGEGRNNARDGEGSGSREMQRDGDRPREGARDGDRPAEGGDSREGARDGDRPREGARDGEGPAEGEKSREGARDGDRPREGARDGEGASEREMRRDGDGDRPREGEGSREGARDGDRPREGEGSRESARDSESSASTASDREVNQWTRIYGAYDKDGDRAVTFDEWVSMKNYELSRDQREREKGWFDQADSNSDEAVTLDEWIGWKSSQGRRS
ncbi:MAG: hypothetical protein KDN19_02520 [Verrucomicrobiae bacterium]|nr:hypothetical protein [Verrucomicrobiae bacterium]